MATLTMPEVYQITDDRIKAGFTKNIIENSPALGLVPFESVPEGQYKFNAENKLASAKSRGYDQEYTEDKATFTDGSVQLKFHGGSFGIDHKLKNRKTFDKENMVKKQLRSWARTLSMDLKALLINGDSAKNPLQPDGIKAIVARNASLIPAGSQAIDFKYGVSNTNGLQINDVGGLITSMNKFKRATLGKPDVIFCNSRHLDLIHALLVNTNNSALATHFRFKDFQAMPGVVMEVGSWGDIPMIPIGHDSQQAEIIDFDETTGSSDFTSSMYAVKFGDDFFKGLWDAPQPELLVSKPKATTELYTLDWMVGFVAEHARSVARMSGILDS